MQNLTLALIVAAITCTNLTAEETKIPSWQTTGPVTKLAKVDLGTWSFADNIPDSEQWVDNSGNKKTHKFPSCYQLDLSGEGDITTGRGYILKDIAPMFGSSGLLQDQRNNLDRLMSSPLMTGTEIVHKATGGPVWVDFMFGAGNFGNRLCYYYVDENDNLNPRAIAEMFANNEIPTFCIDPQMRTSKHMARWKKDATGEWQMYDKENDNFSFTNEDLGKALEHSPEDNYNGWGDDLITGKKFKLKYFGKNYDQEASDDFPKGTRIYFFLATYNDSQWDGETDPREPYSVKFASRPLNAELGTQGNWWELDNHREYGERYGKGVMAASVINFWYDDSNTGAAVNLNLLSWEDRTQPESKGDGTYEAKSDYDMGDVAFALEGVTNPLTVTDDNSLRLRVDPWSDYTPKDNVNHYTHWLNLVDDKDNPIRSCDLQPVTVKDGNIVASYTQASVWQYLNAGDDAQLLKFLVIRKSATLEGRQPGSYTTADLVNPELEIKLDYAFVDSYDENFNNVSFHPVQNAFKRGALDQTAVEFGNITYKYMLEAAATGSHPWKYGYQITFSLNGGKIRNTNLDTVMIPRSEIIVDPRGTAEDIDFASEDEKHFIGSLPEIKNRMYVTVRCADLTDLDTKEEIKAVMLCGTDKFSHYKDGTAPGISDNVLCILTRNNDGNWTVSSENGNYRLAGMSSHDDAQWLVLEADVEPSEVHAVIYTQCEDKKNSQLDNNFYGIAPQRCVLPGLEFDVREMHYEGVPYDEPDMPALFQSITTWRADGFDNNSDILFNEWRLYNAPLYKWYGSEQAYLNVLHGRTPLTGSMPQEKYIKWLGYNTHSNTPEISSNDLTVSSDEYGRCWWTNLDVLVQKYDSTSGVYADYLLRAYYIPTPPANLPQISSRANDAGHHYVVLETGKAVSASQSIWTGIENIAVDSSTEARPVYYNLQGIRTVCPEAGCTYIVVRGGVATKEVYMP